MNSNTDSSGMKSSGDKNHFCYVNNATVVDLDELRNESHDFNSISPTFDGLGSMHRLSTYGDDEYGEEDELHLITTAKVERKNFGQEVRASLDVKHYLDQMSIALNKDSTDLYLLVKDLLRQMKTESHQKLDIHEALSVLFVDSKCKIPITRIQGVINERSGMAILNQSWICLLGSVVSITKRMIGLTKTSRPLNLASCAQEVRFILVILTPTIEKITKNSYEIGRTFATILSDRELRHDLQNSYDVSLVKSLIRRKARELSETPRDQGKLTSVSGLDTNLWENIVRRTKWYPKDFADGIKGNKTVHKTLATSMFLYFSCLLPAIAFGVLNAKNTDGLIGPERALIGQAIGGLIFALIAGQPLVIIATTALVSLYIKVVYEISKTLEVDFFVMYASVGFWNTIFVLIYSVFGWSKLIRFSTRSVEEIFAQFITVCFFFDAIKDLVISFQDDYFSPSCTGLNGSSIDEFINTTVLNDSTNTTTFTEPQTIRPCSRESTLLFIILMLGTLWSSLKIFRFNQSPFLPRGVREFVTDYALPIGVIGFSLIGSFVFSQVRVERFEFGVDFSFKAAGVDFSSWKIVGSCIGLGFALSLLFFMDQNITGQIVNSPCNHLKKGSGPHLDLFAIAIINCLLSFYGIPWMHGVLPQSPLHVRCLADIEERNNRGCIQQEIIRVRETRLTGIIANILIGLSLFMVPYPLDLVPVPVLDGLFLYCAFASLRGSSFFERFLLLFQEQASYPPNHYLRHVRQKTIHLFTIIELIQLGFLCFVGFAPWAYLRMAFPIFIALLIPIRHFILPIMISKKVLKALDSFD
ncbi:solute carrier family 4 member 11-like [Brevipalpus obovatus]|uniref:solute carrier family 4 member 11-like n=1 Tax=Brevipalpus obovatus TaxID=246614 RepID=UPI003D9DBDA6